MNRRRYQTILGKKDCRLHWDGRYWRGQRFYCFPCRLRLYSLVRGIAAGIIPSYAVYGSCAFYGPFTAITSRNVSPRVYIGAQLDGSGEMADMTFLM